MAGPQLSPTSVPTVTPPPEPPRDPGPPAATWGDVIREMRAAGGSNWDNLGDPRVFFADDSVSR